MRNTTIQVGDTVVLSPSAGLGRGRFFVLDVDPHDTINSLYVQGANGATWWTRSSGARVVR